MSIVCLDTQIIQWGAMQRASDVDSQRFIPLAANFLKWLEIQRADIIIPTIIMGEILIPIPPKNHADVLRKISANWMIVDYDMRSAAQFATMIHEQKLGKIVEDMKKGNPYATRRQLIADVMIIAPAIAHGAEKVYSHDQKFLNFAQNYIRAENFLNPSPFHQSLPENPSE